MKCPVDQTTLTIADRQGIEIDFCPTCRGIWLDRGELGKLIERSNSFVPSQRDERYEERDDDDNRAERYDRPQYERRHYEDDEYSGHRDGHHGKHRKKESFLGDLFDF